MEPPKLTEMEPIKKIYSIISNKDRKYSIEITNHHNLIFIYSFYEDDLKKDEYQKEFKIEELKLNKYLSILDSIDEIFYEIINIFDKKLSQIKLLEETNKLIINIPLEGAKINKIILNLDSKIKTTDEKYDELYNIIIKLKKENNNLKINLQKNEEEINELKKCPHPIGAVYTQYPNCKEPKELWPQTNWELLNFNGAFFRAVGGKSLEFGKLQNEGLPNITGNKLLGWTDSSGGGIIMCESTNINKSALYSYKDSNYYSFYYSNPHSTKYTPYHHNILGFNANKANSIFGNSEHVTPENYAIKIWKRMS